MKCPCCKNDNNIGEICEYCGIRTIYCDICKTLMADINEDRLCHKCISAIKGIRRLKKFERGIAILKRSIQNG